LPSITIVVLHIRGGSDVEAMGELRKEEGVTVRGELAKEARFADDRGMNKQGLSAHP
jgi:hypothetical protein